MRAALELMCGEEDFLDRVRRAWADSRFCVSHLVGFDRNHPDSVRELVGRLSQRLVLNFNTVTARPPAWSSISDVPRATDLDSDAHSLR